MEAPMSDWFQPIPQVLDSVAYAVKVLNVISRRHLHCDKVVAVPTGCDGFTASLLSFAAPAVPPDL
jgi:hypothetical protein